VYDPKGRTSAALKAHGLALPKVGEAPLAPDVRVLFVGSEALDTSRLLPPCLQGLADKLATGLQVVFFEQTGGALETFLGLRAVTRASRQLWIRDAAHPFVRGLGNADLTDWRGRTTLAPLDGPPADLEASQRWKGVWRCSHRGTVASVLAEKPHVGAFRPVLDGEFDLRYMALWEVLEGNGRLVFCQADVSDRLGKEPAADRLVANILEDVRNWKPPAAVAACLVTADGTSREELMSFRLLATLNPTVLPAADQAVLVLARGCASWVQTNHEHLSWFLTAGGRALALGLDREDARELSAATGGVLKIEEKAVSRAELAPGLPSAFRGIGPAEVHWRERRTALVVAAVPADGWRSDPGIVARVPVAAGEIIWVTPAPRDFDPERRPDLVFTRVNVRRLWALVLANCGVRSELPWSARLEFCKPEVLSLHGTWRVRKDVDGAARREGWMTADVDERSSAWIDMKVPGLWGEMYKDWYGYLGDVWYRVRFKAPAALARLPLEFYAAAIDDTDECWLNGVKIGETTRDTPKWWLAERHYHIPPGLLRSGAAENVLAVRVNNNFMDAGLLETVRLQVQPAVARPSVIHYVDSRVPRDNPYAYMRW
jgi:hypothetical protein